VVGRFLFCLEVVEQNVWKEAQSLKDFLLKKYRYEVSLQKKGEWRIKIDVGDSRSGIVDSGGLKRVPGMRWVSETD
jgi:hypothetical protein